MSKLVDFQLEDRVIKVSELKVKFIQNIIDAAKLCNSIEKVILFGSVLEERCKPESDIDLAIFGSIAKSKMFKKKSYGLFQEKIFKYNNIFFGGTEDQSYDILYFNMMKKDNSSILEDINTKGEIIYIRKE